MRNLGPLASFKSLRFKLENDKRCKSGMRFIDGKCVNQKALNDLHKLKERAEQKHLASKAPVKKDPQYSSDHLRTKFFKASNDKRIRIDPTIKIIPEEIGLIEEDEGTDESVPVVQNPNDKPFVEWQTIKRLSQ